MPSGNDAIYVNTLLNALGDEGRPKKSLSK